MQQRQMNAVFKKISKLKTENNYEILSVTHPVNIYLFKVNNKITKTT